MDRAPADADRPQPRPAAESPAGEGHRDPTHLDAGQLKTGVTGDPPVGDLAGFRRHAAADALAGLLVFLIALPLCLGIALASGFPALAGVFTAAVGALFTPWLSDSELTIKGPAAGLIVIALGCVNDFGGDGVSGGFTDADHSAYRAALAIGFVAAVLQVAFALLRLASLGERFPSAVVHGMLAAIGVIIFAKQLPIALGVLESEEPLAMLLAIPRYVADANPAVAAIGLASAAVLFAWPTVGRWAPRLGASSIGAVPAPIVAVALAVGLGALFDLGRAHEYAFAGHTHELGEQHLLQLPDRVLGLFDAIATPDWPALAQAKAWKWVVLFFAIGSIESVLSAKAVDAIDPWRRKADLNRDTLAVGVANLGATMVGGLPMISEIVRSKANVDAGARTRFANLWHGVFLLACVAFVPAALGSIPLAALAAILVSTGLRLASPAQFVHAWRDGTAPFVVFLTTLLGVLATDLLIGVAIGVALHAVLRGWRRWRLR
ncbi:MAG: SulP family inorganic anion transporter [Planctomycetota bacterium]